MSAETFHIGDLLSVTTGRLVSPDGMGGVYRILNHLTGDNLFTHQLPAACRIAEPYLLDQHPWLLGIDLPDELSSLDLLQEFLTSIERTHGARHSVAPMPPEAWGHHDPIADLLLLTNGKPVIVVEP